MEKGISSVGGSKARLENKTLGEFQDLSEPVSCMSFTHPEFSWMTPSTDVIQS